MHIQGKKIKFEQIIEGETLLVCEPFADIHDLKIGIAHHLREDGLCWLSEGDMLVATIEDNIYRVEGDWSA